MNPITLISKSVLLPFNKKSPSMVISMPKSKFLTRRISTFPTISKNKQKLTTITKSLELDNIVKIVEYDSYIVTKSILLFSMFYFSLNWLQFRQTRVDQEKKEDEDPFSDKNNKKNKKK
jgi:hypothetical protein